MDVCLELSASLFLLEYKWRSFFLLHTLFFWFGICLLTPSMRSHLHKIDTAWKRARQRVSRNVLFLSGRIQHEIHTVPLAVPSHMQTLFCLVFSSHCRSYKHTMMRKTTQWRNQKSVHSFEIFLECIFRDLKYLHRRRISANNSKNF